jgi:RecJ-like exonuclease
MIYPNGTNARLIEVAAAEIGTIEEGDNLTKYGKFTKADGLPWCGSFVNWCAATAGVKIHSVVSTAVGAHKFKEINRWSNIPQLGYLAFMDFPHDGVDRISHIGIVVGLIDNKTCLTIEGNTSGTGDQRNGGMVMVKVRAFGEGKEIVGFGIPKFTPYKGEFPTVEMPKTAAKPTKEKKWNKPKP